MPILESTDITDITTTKACISYFLMSNTFQPNPNRRFYLYSILNISERLPQKRQKDRSVRAALFSICMPSTMPILFGRHYHATSRSRFLSSMQSNVNRNTMSGLGTFVLQDQKNERPQKRRQPQHGRRTKLGRRMLVAHQHHRISFTFSQSNFSLGETVADDYIFVIGSRVGVVKLNRAYRFITLSGP